jgi:hypothetical protein
MGKKGEGNITVKRMNKHEISRVIEEQSLRIFSSEIMLDRIVNQVSSSESG